MNESDLNSSTSKIAVSRLWRRIPLIVRAILSGYAVYAIAGTVAWAAVLLFIPVPWSLPAMWLVLWL